MENVVLVLAILLCLVWTYQSVVSMTRNWTLTERLNTEKKTLELLSVEVETAELENEYYESQEYLELAARKLANKQLAGEKMVVLPENSEAACYFYWRQYCFIICRPTRWSHSCRFIRGIYWGVNLTG